MLDHAEGGVVCFAHDHPRRPAPGVSVSASEGGPRSANGKGRPLTAQGQDRRADIVEQAKTLFARDGYGDTRMSDIASAAGVTKGLLYWYFENKVELIAEVMRDTRRRLREEQRAAVAGVDDPLERIYLATAASTKFMITNYRLYQVGREVQELTRLLGESTHLHARDTATTLEEGQRLGVIRCDDTPQAMAYGNAGVVQQMSASAFYGGLRHPVDEVATMAARYVIRAVAADTALCDVIEARQAAPARKPSRRRARPAKAR